ncbi:MAG: NAD(P)H-dependent oxidoreductase [Microgenomates group bacterium]
MKDKVISALNWRYATKKFDVTKKISDADFDALVESVRLSPSSLGLQPWKMLIVKDVKLREKLKVAAHGQPQVLDSSHFIVFAARKNLNEKYINSYLSNVAKIRKQTDETLGGYKQMLFGSVSKKNAQQILEWNTRQTYIALGVLLESAALFKIDACPMEGFNPEQFDQILNLTETDYSSVVIAAVGYRSVEDKYASTPKVRFAKKDIVIEL